MLNAVQDRSVVPVSPHSCGLGNFCGDVDLPVAVGQEAPLHLVLELHVALGWEAEACPARWRPRLHSCPVSIEWQPRGTQSSSHPVIQSSSRPVPVIQSPSHPVAQSSSRPVIQSPSLPVAQSSSLPVTQSPSRPVTQSSSRPVAQSSSSPVIQSSSHPVAQSSSHPVIQSPSHPVIQSPSRPVAQSDQKHRQLGLIPLPKPDYIFNTFTESRWLISFTHLAQYLPTSQDGKLQRAPWKTAARGKKTPQFTSCPLAANRKRRNAERS